MYHWKKINYTRVKSYNGLIHNKKLELRSILKTINHLQLIIFQRFSGFVNIFGEAEHITATARTAKF